MRNKKKILVIVFILVFIFSGVSMAFNLKIKLEDNLLLSESEKKVSLRLEDEAGELVKDNRRLMLKVTRGGVLENEYLNEGIKLVDGKAEFTYLAPKSLGRSEIVIIDTQTNKSIKKSLIIVNRKQLQRHSESGYAAITDFEGEVLVKSGENDSWDSAVVGQKLHKNDFIKTQVNSWSTLSLFDGSEITIEPATEFKIVNLTGDVNKEKLDQGIFKLIMGTVINKVNELTGRGSRYEIETDSATAGVRGTYFEVSYQEGKNLVRVYEGSVRTEAKSTDRVYVINEQEEITIDQNAAATVSEAGIQNQIKKHNTTQAEKIKEIEAKKEEIREKVLENKARAESNKLNNKGGKNNSDFNNGNKEDNKGRGNNSSNSDNGKSINNKEKGNNNSSSNNDNRENNNDRGNSSNSNNGKDGNSSSNSNNGDGGNENIPSNGKSGTDNFNSSNNNKGNNQGSPNKGGRAQINEKRINDLLKSEYFFLYS
ncbi:FecR family protein [Halanaerobium saccharolyticum]|uniref:FecR family protein n=2 Tax=Halanaerobium saccharolyticum TaxID=43595 RepID=A0A4R6M230_9FIRM|nr:FecR family protein [Halanaerobium saccharolyticum]